MLKYSTANVQRDFIHSIMCPRQDGQTHYLKQCVEGSCNNCGGLSLWYDCIHESDDQAFRNAIFENQNFQYKTYQLHDGKESRKIKLVTSQVKIYMNNIHLTECTMLMLFYLTLLNIDILIFIYIFLCCFITLFFSTLGASM